MPAPKIRPFLLAFALILSLSTAKISLGACHVVTPTGSGTHSGSDWSNALASLPSVLVRGDTYYLGAGTYAGYSFSTPESGTLIVTVKSATTSDHCTDTGWNVTAMAGTAVFTKGWGLNNGYITVDGQGRTGLRSGYGIQLNTAAWCSSLSQSFCWAFSVSNNTALSNVTLRYVDFVGQGSAFVDSHYETSIRSVSYGALGGLNSITIQYCYMHNTAGTPIQLVGAQNVVIDHNLFDTNYGSAANHAEAISDNGSSNVTVRYNEFKNVQNTGIIVELNAGPVATADRWFIYGNVFYQTVATPLFGNGAIDCINGNTCSNWLIYNNTFDGIPGSYSGVTYLSSPGTPIIVNNLWFNCTATRVFILNPGSTEDYNSGLNTQTSSGDFSGSHDVLATGQPNPFSGDVIDSWALVNETNKGIGNGLALPSPYNVDPNGTVRGSTLYWDRGAYQYNSGTSNSVTPPSSLTAIVM